MSTRNRDDKAYYRELKADPVRYAHLLETKRKYQRLQRLINPREHPQGEAERKRRWRAEHRDIDRQHRRAHSAVAYALGKGLIVRPPFCSLCWTVCEPEAHHYLGYAKEHKLDIIWVCASCHGRQHYAEITKALLAK